MRRRSREDGRMPLLEHVLALRKVLMISAYAVAIGTVLGWFFSDQVFAFLAQPVTRLQSITFITEFKDRSSPEIKNLNPFVIGIRDINELTNLGDIHRFVQGIRPEASVNHKAEGRLGLGIDCPLNLSGYIGVLVDEKVAKHSRYYDECC